MDTAQDEQSSLHVGRFSVQYLVPSDHPAPESVRARLDEPLIKMLPGAIGAALSQCFSNTDTSIWFIRRLGLDLDINLSWDDEQLARTWAVQFARQLVRDLSEDGESQGIVRFANRPVYLSRFLIDLVGGCAWGKWYYKQFDGLRMLPLSAALRTALCEQPADGLNALLHLSPADVSKIVCALNTQDARRILARFTDDGPTFDEPRCFVTLWAAWESAELGSLGAEEEGRNALRLYFCARREEAKLSGSAIRTAALALLRLARCLVLSSVAGSERLLAAITLGDVTALYREAGAGDAETLLPLMRCSPAWVKEVGETLLARYAGQVSAESAGTQGPVHTPCGGIFLLLPLLDALPLKHLTQGWPDAADGTSAQALVRFLVLIKCCGEERAHRAFLDPLVRELLKIGPALTPAAVDEWQAGIPLRRLETFTSELAEWQREQGALRGVRLALMRVSARRGAVGILLDLERGCWMFAAAYRARQTERFIERLRRWLSLSEQQAELILTERRFAATLGQALPSVQVLQFDDERAAGAAVEDERLKATLSNPARLKDDLAYLSLPLPFHLSSSFELACSIAAQSVMRALAWRLPGFAGSGLAYLYRNFLDFAGSVEEEPERYVVRLGRPPLNIVLGLTGMVRGAYRLDYLSDERPFTLFQEE